MNFFTITSNFPKQYGFYKLASWKQQSRETIENERFNELYFLPTYSDIH